MALFPKRLQNLFTRVRYGAIELTNKRYEKITGQVLEIRQGIQELSNEELKHRSVELKQQIATSQSDRNLEAFFAVVREVAYRTVAMRPYEVQLVAGLALNQGRMVEMQTGEGKTLAAVAPVCWHAIAGRGAHVLTFNDYLTKRDAQWMGPIYEFLGFRVGYVTQGMPAEQRQAAYDCDITYVTAKEVGFD
jgi:preprotein translocase subunit SecA